MRINWNFVQIGAVNFPKPYRGKCVIILWNYWWKEFEERRTKLNKLQGYGTSFHGWEKWEDIWVISPQSQKYLWLYFFSLYKPIEEKMRSNFLSLFLPIFVSLLPHHFHLLQAFLCWKSAVPIFFLLLRCVSWVFTLVFHICFGWWLMRVVQVLRNVLLSWIYI